MLSALLPRLLLRRPPLAAGSGCALHNQGARRWAASRGRKQALAAQLRKDAKSRKQSVAGGKRKKYPITTAAGDSSMAEPPPPQKSLPKAPHMHRRPASTLQGSAALAYLAANPLISLGVIPIVALGVTVVFFRPELMPEFLGGSGKRRSDGIKEDDGANFNDAKEPLGSVPPAAYENAGVGGGGSLKEEEEREIIRAIASDEGGAANGSDETSPAGNGGALSPGESNIIGGIEEEETNEPVDWISAIGIRPHPGS